MSKMKKDWKKWNWENLEVQRLEKPVKTNFIFKPKMIGHPNLDCLRQFAVKGKVPVKIIGYHDNSHGRIAVFYPENMAGVVRCALIQNFDISIPSTGKPAEGLKELLSL